MSGPYYCEALKRLCEERRAQGVDPAVIALEVREKFPKFPRFTAKAAIRVGMRYEAKKDVTPPVKKRRLVGDLPTTCQYITFASWPGRCGCDGYPYCPEHKRATAKNEGFSSSWPQFKSYNY